MEITAAIKRLAVHRWSLDDHRNESRVQRTGELGSTADRPDRGRATVDEDQHAIREERCDSEGRDRDREEEAELTPVDALHLMIVGSGTKAHRRLLAMPNQSSLPDGSFVWE